MNTKNKTIYVIQPKPASVSITWKQTLQQRPEMYQKADWLAHMPATELQRVT